MIRGLINNLEEKNKETNIIFLGKDRNLENIILEQGILSEEHRIITSTSGENIDLLIGNQKPTVVIIEEPHLNTYKNIVEYIETTLSPTIIIISSKRDIKTIEKELKTQEGIILKEGTFIYQNTDPYELALNIRAHSIGAITKSVAERDPLTGLITRKIISKKLEEAWKKTTLNYHLQRESDKKEIPYSESLTRLEHLGIIYLDLDYFKKINDEISHEKGDQIIKLLAESIREIFQREGKGDYCSRIGGEEYLLVIENTPQDNLLVKLGELRELFKEKSRFNEEEKILLGREYQTFSAGIMTYSPNGLIFEEQRLVESIFDPKLLIEIVDYSCQKAKEKFQHRGGFIHHNINEALNKVEKEDAKKIKYQILKELKKKNH